MNQPAYRANIMFVFVLRIFTLFFSVSFLVGQNQPSTISGVVKSSPVAASGDLQLVEAVEKRDKEAVRSLLKEHANVNTAQADGATALAWAAHWDDLETAEILIRSGANVNTANDLGITPLSLACTNRSAPMVEMLLKAGADPNTAQWSGETALMTCASTGNVDAAKSLLAHGADVNRKETRRGQTALMWAVAEKHPEVARALIEHGADVHVRSKSGFTPLLFAAQVGDLDAAGILLEAGANVNDATPEYGSTLVVASASGHEALSLFLLEKGADTNVSDSNGYTALHYTVPQGLDSINGIGLQSSRLFRPNMLELVKALLAHRANPNARIVKDYPLFSRSGSTPSISMVGATPFFLAAAADDVSVMRVLVEGGADPLLATKENTTPLMVAAGVGRIEERPEAQEREALQAIKLAVQLGAEVNAATEYGLTALHGAANTGANAIIQFLVDNGAKVDVKNKFGQTPLILAEGDPEKLGSQSARSADRPYAVHKSTANLLRELGGGTTLQTAPAAQRSGSSSVDASLLSQWFVT